MKRSRIDLQSRDIRAFAKSVRMLAELSSRANRFGDDLVFIGPIRRVWTSPRYLTRAEFDALLVQAQHDSLIQLERADLVGAMDPDLVRESELRHLNATFHFVRI